MDKTVRVSMPEAAWTLLDRYLFNLERKLAKRKGPKLTLGAVIGAVVAHFLVRNADRITKEYVINQVQGLSARGCCSESELELTGLSSRGDNPTT